MDPITHGVIGGLLAVGAGHTASISEPVFLASVLGAMAPDLDIVYHLKGQLSYLKNHRGKSHGPIGLILWSSIVTGVISIYTNVSWEVWAWAFIGGISHTFIDSLNSYGVQLYGIKKHQKISLNLLQVFDPVILILGLLGWLFQNLNFVHLTLLALASWIGLRYYFRRQGERKIYKWLTGLIGEPPCRIVVMPAMWGIWRWDFVAEYQEYYLSGSWWMNKNKITIAKEITRVDGESKEIALQTKVGQFFTSLTPVYAITREDWQDQEVLVFYDLRYLVGDRFLHRATIVLDERGLPYTQILQPFREDNCINL